MLVILMLRLFCLVASVSSYAPVKNKLASLSHRSAASLMFLNFFKAASSSESASAASKKDMSTELDFDERRRAALLGLYIADATAMPVHWMYNLQQLKKDYGKIVGFVKPKDTFEGSIMNLSNTGGGGRGSDQGDIVGSVILHGKKKYWLRGGNFHYHLGLEAGENTLEAQLCRVLTRSIVETSNANIDNSAVEPLIDGSSSPRGITRRAKLSISDFVSKYLEFMQTPGSHNDTYASTAHRMFFANVVRGKDPVTECADNDGHNTDAIDALTLAVPVIVAYAHADRTVRNDKIRDIIAVTRKSRVLQSYAEQYADILTAVLQGATVRDAIDQYDPSGSTRRAALNTRQADPMVACYIDSAYPAMLMFAYRYADSLETCILASANAGGENVARGALLGALLGAQYGRQGFSEWMFKLKNYDLISVEVDALLTATV